MKHTPGPWKAAIKYLPEAEHIIKSENGAEIAIVHEDMDARLIAEAPELMRILIEMVDRYDGLRALAGHKPGKLSVDARAAIVKATGE